MFVRRTDPHGMICGALPGVVYRDTVLKLEPGDTIFINTDGVTDAMSTQGEFFGLERLLDALNQTQGMDPEGIIGHVRETVEAFAQGANQTDDMTMLCMEYKGKG